MKAQAPPLDKRRAILDAAVRVFARTGFHACRVSDIAREAAVAYGLIYHYFGSKEQILDELFAERWQLMLGAIREADRTETSACGKLERVAGFIIDSYRHDPELMKVIIVEVTRAANSFGQTHLPEIREAYRKIADIVEAGQRAGELRADVDPRFAAMVFYGGIEQLLTGWIFGTLPGDGADFDRARTALIETLCQGLQPR